MVARQQHGFNYENYVINKFKLIKSENYLSKDDAYTIDNNGNTFPIQTKCIKFGSPIDLGSLDRNRNKSKDFALILGFWNDGIIGKEIVDEHLLIINIDWWTDLFQAPNGFYDEINNFLKNISNNKEDDDKWAAGYKEYEKVWKDSWKDFALDFSEKWGQVYKERPILPRFKRDHKTQKRIQCAIPNKLFYKYFLRWA